MSKKPKHISEILQSIFGETVNFSPAHLKNGNGEARYKTASVEVHKPSVSKDFFPGINFSPRF